MKPMNTLPPNCSLAVIDNSTGNLTSVAVDRADFDPPVEHRAFAGGEVMGQACLVRGAKGRAGRSGRTGAAPRLFPRPAEDFSLCAFQPMTRPSVSMTTTAIKRGVEHGLQTGVKEPP